MPELPEVETIKRQLELVLVGQVVESVEVLNSKSFEGDVGEVVGKRVVGVERKGKMLIVGLGGGENSYNEINETTEKNEMTKIIVNKENGGDALVYLLIHLKMTGQLIYDPEIRNSKNEIRNPPHFLDISSRSSVETSFEKLQRASKSKISKSKNQNGTETLEKSAKRFVGGHPSASWIRELPDKHTRVIFELTNGTLFFNDQRKFGWVRVATSDKLQETRSKMPYDIVNPEMDEERFFSILGRSNRAVKLVVMDSALIGGSGNIYTNDGLNLAKIDPRRSAKSLTREESDRLLACLKQVVNLGIELGGATASDDKFVHTSGLGGKYQDHFLVYEREGQDCKNCGGVIEKIKIGGRGTYWCRKCQK